MNKLQVDYFLTVANCLSFTEAARTFFVTQSAISKQITAMEKELGVCLFDRTGRHIFLSKAGQIFYDYYKEEQIRLQQAMDKAKQVNSERFGSVRFGFVKGWVMPEILISQMKTFTSNFPNIKIKVECMGPESLFRELWNNKLDVILTIGPMVMTMDHMTDKYNEIKEKQLMKAKRMLCFPSDHPLASRKNLTVTDFVDDTFFIFKEQEESIKRVLQKKFAALGRLPEIVILENVESAIASAECGLGVAIVNEWHKAVQNSDLCSLDMGESYNISLVMKEESTNEEAAVFMNELYMLMAK